METDEISERYIAQCFVNGLEAFDCEINLAFDENLISNDFAVKLCLDYEVKKGTMLVKKDLIIALKGELYFVKFIINPKKDDFIPGVILGRSFLRLSHGIFDFGNGMITIYPEPDPFEDDSEKTGKSSDDWDQLLDFNFDDVPKSGEELSPFICKMGKSNRNKKRAMENFNLFYQDKDKVELNGKTVKEDEEAVKRIKGRALKEKEDPGAFIFPIRLEGKVNENALADIGSDINTMPYRIFETIGREDMKKFIILDIPIDRDAPIVVGRGFLPTRFDVLRTAKSDTDDEEEYVIMRNKFRAPIYGPRPAPYLNFANPEDRSSAIQAVTNPFKKINVWKKAVIFLGSLPIPLKQVNWKPDYKGSYMKEEEATGQWRTKISLTDPLQEHTTEKPDRHDPNAQEMKPWKSYCFHKFTTSFYYGKDVPEMLSLGCDGEIDDMLRIRVQEAESEEEIFTSVAWIRAFNISEPIYAELCHEFYSTYEFDEVCADDELQLGLYQAVELEEDGFNVYFEGGLRSDDNFNATNYWLSISREENLSLSRSHTSTIKNPILRDLYDRMGRMEIRQDAIERMEYRQSYHWDIYHGVFKHMAGGYSVPLQGTYNPPGYAQPLQEHTAEKPDRHDPNAQEMKPWKSYCFHKFTTSFYYRKDVPEMLSLGCDGEIDDMLRIRVQEAELEEEIFTSVAWIRAFNINEPIYAELCHEFYSTYEFDEVCADDELQSKNIIKFRLGGRAHSLTLLEFARRLGLYQVVELEEDGFNVYFEGGLCRDDNFNAMNYWLSISREENLSLSRSHTSTIRNPILWVIHKMITYSLYQRTTGYDKMQKNDLWLLSIFNARHQNGYANVAWVITKWMKRKGVRTQKESQIYCGQFISKLARKCRVLTEDVVRSLSAPIYCRDLDTTTLRDLIDSDGKLIPEDPQPGVPRVGIPRPPRASMQDLYDRMGHMEIRQDAIERMEYRQSYH
ncbi:hypothetical protein Tco_0093381 [Tanacetum coccineum]